MPASSSLDAASNAAAAAAAAQGRAGRRRRSSGGATAAARAATAVASVLNAQATGNAPADGLVAVKVRAACMRSARRATRHTLAAACKRGARAPSHVAS